ncbi:MAG: PilZ domain-containing protein [Acidobacteriota bacterium]
MEQRRTQRYKLQLPLQILQVNEERVNRTEKTRDISSGGVCFTSQNQVDVGGRIEYIITLSGSTPPVRIRCLGKVLRSQTNGGDGQFEVAVTMERYSFVRPDEVADLAVSA